MFVQPRWSIGSLPSLIAGFIWILESTTVGPIAAVPLWIIGVVLLAAGVSQLAWPGDRRINQAGALAGALGAIVSLAYLFVVGPLAGLLLLLAALAGTWGAGRMALQLEPHVEGVPPPRPTFKLAAKVAVDDLILGLEQFQSTGFALDGSIERIIGEVDRAHALFESRGLIENPEAYHMRPPDLIDPEIRVEEIAGHRVEILRFESGYAPAEGEPGRERWLGYDPCREGWAYVLRHEGPPRPWLIATNGYRMGHARVDVSLFDRFYADGGSRSSFGMGAPGARMGGPSGLGLNVLIPVLPLHGPRRLGWHSGSGFLGVDVMNTVHGAAQAMWDMRRLLSWVRSQDAPAVGAFGLSLGGYTTALFASLAEDLTCAVPGIPVAEFSRLLQQHGSPQQLRYAESIGFDLARIREMMRVVSPLALRPQVPHAGRMIFGATADRLVSPDQVRDLWRHWEEPEIVWYEGTHVTFQNERAVWSAVDRTMRESGLSA